MRRSVCRPKNQRGWRCARSRSSRTRAGSPRSPIPFGGSFYIEELTDKIERGAQDYLERIDALGGTLAAIEKGWIQAEIQNAAYEFQQQVERGEKIVVGVNRFQQEDETSTGGFANRSCDRASTGGPFASRCARRAIKAVVESRLDALEQTARGSDNLMPKIMAACEAYATVGEISDRLRKVFGEYREG